MWDHFDDFRAVFARAWAPKDYFTYPWWEIDAATTWNKLGYKVGKQRRIKLVTSGIS